MCIYKEPATSSGRSAREAVEYVEPAFIADRRSPPLPPCSLSAIRPRASSMSTIAGEFSAEGLNPWIKEHGTSMANLLHHFSNNSMTIIGQLFSPQFWDLACGHRFLSSTVLAASACHLRHFSVNIASHHIAELGQLSAAITAMKSALALPLNKECADALFCMAVMLNGINFAYVMSNSMLTSWVFSDSPDRLDWLDLQLQFKNLEEAISPFRGSNLLRPITNTANGQRLSHEVPRNAQDANLERVPITWRWLAGSKDTQNYHLYWEPLQVLAELRNTQPNYDNSIMYFGFIKTLENGFRNLLFSRDIRALWILGYWLGLLGRLNIWWCSRRVERDRAAILCFLREKELGRRPGDEGRMWQVLIADLGVASEWPPP
jgi:hypothetical protein